MRRSVQAFIALSLVSGTALADKTGVELMIRPAYGSAGAKSPVVYSPGPTQLAPGAAGDIFTGTASPYGGGLIGDAYAGYRFLPILSAGLNAGFRKSSATAPSGDGTTNLTRSGWRAGFYARAYLPLIPSFDPWASIGIGYMGDSQSYDRPVQGVVGTYKLTHNGIEVPLGVGFDYSVLPLLAMGPSFEYALVSGAGGCLKTSAPGLVGQSFCTDAAANQKITAAKSYNVWSLGLDVRVTL